MAEYRINADKTGPRSYKKELQMISYRGEGIFSDEGNVLLAENDVYYPPDFLASGAVSVVTDSSSYKKDGLSLGNKFSTFNPAALPIEEQFKEETEVSKTLLGINRSETQQGIFDNVSSYGLDTKDWVVYSGWGNYGQGDYWEYKNSPAGRHQPAINYDDDKGSSIVLSSYPAPYTNPGNPVVGNRVRGITAEPGVNWGKYLQGLIAMYIIEYMVNNFTPSEKALFQVEFLEKTYPKKNGKFNRLYWDQIWLDYDQRRNGEAVNTPIMPDGVLYNMTEGTINIADLLGSTSLDPEDQNQTISYQDFFFASTRYIWEEPNEGHYRIKTTQDADVWAEYFNVDFDSLPEDLKNWEFKVWESPPPQDSPEVKYSLPYYLITSKTPFQSLIFGSSWPKQYSDPLIPQITGAIAEGNTIGGVESAYAVVTMSSNRAFRYQPGRISGFTYGVRVSEEGAGPGSVLEFGVENFTDGYFFRLKDGTDFSIVRRSTIPLGSTQLFLDAGYDEREVYINQITGVATYKDGLTDSEVLDLEDEVEAKRQVKSFETVIQQNQMNGDGLNSKGDTGYVYNPDTVTMYKIEFGWYGAIGARFYMYIPTGSGTSRWVALHTLVIENNINQPCLADPFFFFKYRVYVESPSRIRLPQFLEKYGASYYIDGGDEGTVTVSNSTATNRVVERVSSIDVEVPLYKWGTMIGIKPKQYITNSAGNEFFNKKEIFPLSASVISTKPAEIKFVNQFGCQENAFTFQEGYKCELPESQRLRGLFSINPLEKEEGTLQALGRNKEDFTPTITYVGSDSAYPSSAQNLDDGGGGFVGWQAFNRSLAGAHIVGEKLYCGYINPYVRRMFNDGNAGSTVVIGRSTREHVFIGPPSRNRNWVPSELNFNYPLGSYPLKISKFRKDTTLISSVPIISSEFYLLFTTKGPGGDDYNVSCTDENFSTKCDGKHFGDLTLGVLWPTADPTGGAPALEYPQNICSLSRALTNAQSFGIIDPAIDETSDLDSAEVTIEGSGADAYVVDKTIPSSDSYRYYDGLPVDVFAQGLEDNTILVNQAGVLAVNANGLEIAEGSWSNGSTAIDFQLPQVPGAEGGVCNALFCRVGNVEEEGVVSRRDPEGELQTIGASDVYYIKNRNAWPSSLYATQSGDPSLQVLIIEKTSDLSSVRVTTTGGAQIPFTPEGSSVREFYLPVIANEGESLASYDGEEVVVKYNAISMYSPSLIKKDDRLLERRIVGLNVLPLRWFIAMREGAEIGSISVGQVTPNGIVQTPFSPHGSTLSVGDEETGDKDEHGGGGKDSPALKSIRAFTEPNTLNIESGSDFSYYDPTTPDISKTKKCGSFVSNTLLSGSGVATTGDYPIRWLKFKDSGRPLGSFYVSANTPTELDLKSLFNISAESVGPSFWGNKALFAIVKNLEEGGADGKMSITINYKEQ